MRQARRRFQRPSVAAPTAATRTATGSHSRRCFAAIRDGPGLPHGRFGKIRPSARVAAVAVPYGHRRSFAAAASVSASVPARFLAGSLRAGALAAVFMSPVWQPPPESARLPHRRARATAAVPPGRGLCAWIHAPARTPAVIAGCRHAAPAQHQCSLPRRLSAEGLTRAFAPRRATSGLVRIPPASAANGGESRSLGKRIDAAQCWRLCQPHPRSRHAGFRCAAALRGVAGVATYRFTRSCYTVFQARRLPHSMWQPPRPLAQGEATPVRFSANGCHTATAWRDPPESPQRVPPRTPATRERRLPPALNHHCGITRHRLQHPVQAAAWGLGASAHRDPQPHPVFPQPAATRDGLARPA